MYSPNGSDLFNATTTPSSYRPSGVAVIRAAAAILIMILGVMGNGTIIAVIVRTRSLRNITGVFLVNLAVADLCVAIWTLPFIVDAAILGWWRFGDTWCQVSGFLEILFTSASVSTLGLISYDRYVAIVKPLHYQQCMTAPRATFYLVCTWVLSITCACLPMSNVASYAYIEDIGACTVDWERSTLGYTIFAHLISFCLPLAMILYCYAKIFIVARKVKRQIRPHPANFAEHPSRWVNERSGCDRQTESKASKTERTIGDHKEMMISLPEQITSVETRLGSHFRDIIKSPKSEGHFNIQALSVEDKKRSKSAQDISHDHVFSRHGNSSEETEDRKVNFSVHTGLSMVPTLFQANPSAIRQTDINANTRDYAQKRPSLNGKHIQSKRFHNRHKSSTSGESGEWKPLTSKHVSRKAVRLKKMQTLRDTKAATTLLILLGVFLVCWMPYVVISFLLNAHREVRAIVHSALFMVALTNSVLNVFVYGVLNTKFRLGFRKLWKPCCLWLSCKCKNKSDTSAMRLRSISQSVRNNNGHVVDRGEVPDRREYFSEQVR